MADPDSRRIVTQAAIPPWTCEQVCADGDAWFDALGAAIDGARASVWLELFILGDDAVGQALTAALERAATRGVEVHLLVDGVGSAAWITARARAAAGSLMAVRVYHPTPWQACGGLMTTMPRLPRALRFLRLINSRNHRKLALIDGKVAWLGSFNGEVRHSRRGRGEAAWRDTGVRLEGAGVAALAQAFANTWARSWVLAPGRFRPSFAWRLRAQRLPVEAPLRLWQGVVARRRLRADLVRRIAGARERVWLRTPYFVPPVPLLRALMVAARRGAVVQVVVPAANDVPFMPWIAALLARRLAAAGVQVLAYPGMLHAKTQVIDGWVAVGSLNLNGRSLRRDLELEAVLVQPAAREEVAALHRADAALAVPLDGSLRWWQALAAHALLWVRWWI
jgi:cardiolipin synthase